MSRVSTPAPGLLGSLWPWPPAFPTDRLPICWPPLSRNRSTTAASTTLARTFGWVQKVYAQIIAEEDELQTEVFKHGIIPPRNPQEREIILVKVDGTFLCAQREEGTQFEVRLPSRTPFGPEAPVRWGEAAGVPLAENAECSSRRLAVRTVCVLTTGKVLESPTAKFRPERSRRDLSLPPAGAGALWRRRDRTGPRSKAISER